MAAITRIDVRPETLWSQERKCVNLTLRSSGFDTSSVVIDITPRRIAFVAAPTVESGCKPGTSYAHVLELYADIDADASTYCVFDREVRLTLVKAGGAAADWWPRLLQTPTKQHWLRVDFSKWKGDSDGDVADVESASAGATSSGRQDNYFDNSNPFAGTDFGGLSRGAGGAGGMPFGFGGDGQEDFNSDDDEEEEVEDEDANEDAGEEEDKEGDSLTDAAAVGKTVGDEAFSSITGDAGLAN